MAAARVTLTEQTLNLIRYSAAKNETTVDAEIATIVEAYFKEDNLPSKFAELQKRISDVTTKLIGWHLDHYEGKPDDISTEGSFEWRKILNHLNPEVNLCIWPSCAVVHWSGMEKRCPGCDRPGEMIGRELS